jgi:hypothetical protein
MLRSVVCIFIYGTLFQGFGFFLYKVAGLSKERTIALLVCLIGAMAMDMLHDIRSAQGKEKN